jgi:hypothetical protein
MSKESSKGTAIIQQLLEQRRQYEGWIARLNAAADATPGHVRAKVRADYEVRLAAVTEELKAHAESARQALEQKKHFRSELQKKEALAAEKLTETELRHAVGEFGEAQWSQIHQDVLAELVSVREDLQAVEADLQKLEELDALASSKPVAAPRSAPAPQPHHPQPRPHASEVDELAFIKSVTEDEKGGAPSARRASGVQFQPTVPADAAPPRAPAPTRPITSTPAPVVPESSATANDDEAAAKTIKCLGCGTMNLPTEWYCEQCGAELAAV